MITRDATHNLIKRTRPLVVAIDGELGAGKTTLASELSRIHNYSCIHLDDFLQQEQGMFVNAIKLSELRKALHVAKRPLIIEGICLLQILRLLDVSPSVHVFLGHEHGNVQYKSSPIISEVDKYIQEYQARETADLRLCAMQYHQTNQLDVDIAYIKAKTIVSAILALGGILAIIVGALVLNSGIQSENSTVLSILGAEVTAKGVGAVILSSSVMWAYFSYLSRPNYSRTRESRTNITEDGVHEQYEFDSATMNIARPRNMSGRVKP